MNEVRFSSAADADIVEILAHTYEEFGWQASLRYESLIATAVLDLSTNCRRHGVVLRADLGPSIFSYHLRNSRNRAGHRAGIVHWPRHLILFRQIHPSIIGIGRILHDAMELRLHAPKDFGDG